MMHLLHMFLFASLVSGFFAFLLAPEGRRLRYGLTLWTIMAGAALLLGLTMFAAS